MRGYQLPPRGVSQCRILQDREIPFEEPGVALCAGDADSEPVVIGRPGARIPEFLHVPRRKADLMVLSMQKLRAVLAGPQNGLSC